MICSKCRLSLHEAWFQFRKDTGKHRSYCNMCKSLQDALLYSKEYYRELYQKSLVVRRANKNVWRSKNKDRINAEAKKFYKEHRQARLENSNRYYVNNRVKILIYLREKNSLGLRTKFLRKKYSRAIKPITEETRNFVIGANIKFYGVLTCELCGRSIEGKLNIDHKMPIARGGSNEINNLCVAHASCNHSKLTRTPYEWIREVPVQLREALNVYSRVPPRAV